MHIHPYLSFNRRHWVIAPNWDVLNIQNYESKTRLRKWIVMNVHNSIDSFESVYHSFTY